MRRCKVVTVFGTRPEAIKLAPVLKALEKQKFDSVVVVTAQHREMLDQVLNLFSIEPNYDLDIMQPAQELFDITEKALNGLKPILEKEKPQILLVQGDTTTTFAAALAAFYLKIEIGHIEAGLRTFDKYHPFPEEINRQLTSRLVDFHFAPTEIAKENLLKEGIPAEKIYVTGNTVIDALLATVKDDYSFSDSTLSKIDFENRKLILVTAHRRENWGDPLKNICLSIKKLVETHLDIEIVFSVHLNPQVQQAAESILANVERVHLVNPLEYEPFVQFMNKSYLILTDSGGIQEEAPSLGKPVLVLREVTERPEVIAAGTAKLVGTDVDKIVETTSLLLKDENVYNKMARATNPYGDGHASERIIKILEQQLLR
jgi:UDP-N-acetylglucosamine 2-epimerase (non-hydrolysing)